MEVLDSAFPLAAALVFPAIQTHLDILPKEQGDLVSQVRFPLEIVDFKSSAVALIL